MYGAFAERKEETDEYGSLYNAGDIRKGIADGRKGSGDFQRKQAAGDFRSRRESADVKTGFGKLSGDTGRAWVLQMAQGTCGERYGI